MIKRFAFPLTLTIVAILASTALWWSTPAGIGLTNDSAAYISGARSLMEGTGYSETWLAGDLEPITHYPPLLSITLAGIGALGFDPLRGVRGLNILLWGINTALMGLLVWRMTRSQPAGVLAALLFALNASLFRVHAFALSEPLFLMLSFLAFLLFDFSFEGQSPRQNILSPAFFSLFFSGFSVGLAFLARYSGLALLATLVMAFFLLRSNWSSRIARSGVFLFGALPLMVSWVLRNALIAQNATNRTIDWHPITSENIERGLYNAMIFLFPYDPLHRDLWKSQAIPGLLACIGFVLVIWLLVRARDFWMEQRAVNILLFSTSLYIFGYLGSILTSITLFDASTRLEPRILAPLYVSWIILFSAGMWWLWNKQHIIGRSIVILLAASALGLSIYGQSQAMLEYRDAAGLGYGSWRWRDSLVMEALKDLPPEITIYTNSPPAVYFGAKRPSLPAPTPIDPGHNTPRDYYDEHLKIMREDILAGRAVLALFDYPDGDYAQFVDGLNLAVNAQRHRLYTQP